MRMAPVCTTCGGDVDPRQHAVIDTVGTLGRYYRTAEERERELGAPLCEGCWYTAEVARRAEQVEQSDQPQEDPAPPEQTPETMLIALLESLGFRRG